MKYFVINYIKLIVFVLTSRRKLVIFDFQQTDKSSTIVLSIMNMGACISVNLRTIVTKTVHVTFFYRNPSKISTSFHLKSRMYQGLHYTWHAGFIGERNADGYPYLCTSSWPEVLPWPWEIWPRSIQWRWKGEETSLRVFALRRGSEDMYR